MDDDDDPLRSVMFAGFIMMLFVWAITSIFIAGIIEWLWNALLPPLAHWPSINYEQAWALYVAVSIIVVIIVVIIKGIADSGEEQ
jgi:low affinity Fe/Cu permease